MRCKLLFVVFSLLCLFLISFAFAFSVGKFSIKAPNFCGDNTAAGTEECDRNDFKNRTCVSLRYSSGSLKCTSECTLNESLCIFSLTEGNEINILRQCNDGIDNDNDNFIDYPNDNGCTNYLDNSEQDVVCISNWTCEESVCINGTKMITCLDKNYCKEEYSRIKYGKCSEFAEEIQNIFKGNFNLGELLSSKYFYFIVIIIVIVLIIGAIIMYKLFVHKKLNRLKIKNKIKSSEKKRLRR